MKRFTLSSLGLSVLLLAASAVQAGPVNINTADAATLAAELVGVGPALAQAIVEDRAKNGRFGSAEELARVSGIGMSIVANNREFILVADSN
jgi:competence protein ComEA